MSRIQKQVQKKDLSKYRTWITDTSPTSDYFRLAQIPEVLSGGKSGFLINGSPNLVNTTEVLIEIIDVNGNTIFLQPIRDYQEGLARVVSIEVYDDTPPGPATITILGEVSSDITGIKVPSEWVGRYNVKWQKTINIEPTKPNITQIRLYDTPLLSVSERLLPYRRITTGSMTSVSTSFVSGEYKPGAIQFVQQDSQYVDIESQQRIVRAPTTFITVQSASFNRYVAGGTFYATVDNNPFTSSIDSVFSDTALRLTGFVTGSDGENLKQWSATDWRVDYQSAPVFETRPLTRSFAEIELEKLTTFTGDIQRARFYMRGVDHDTNYGLIDDVVLDRSELTVSESFTGELFSLGDIQDQTFIDTYWIKGTIANGNAYIESPSVSLSYDTSTYLDSVYISNISSLYTTNSTVPLYWFGINKSIDISKFAEYTFEGNIIGRVTSPDVTAQMDVYLYGSQSARGIDNALGLRIASLTIPAGQTQVTYEGYNLNFVPLLDDSVQLRFVVYSGVWNIAGAHIISARESGFNPDQISVFVPIIGRRLERLQFKVELFDANSNLVPINIESDSIYFDGGNVVVQGTDNRIDGRVTIASDGHGPMLGSDSTKLTGIVGISGDANNYLPYPIHINDIINYSGSPIITMYSGSQPYSGSSQGPAMGLQIASGNPTGSFFDYNTQTGTLTIRGDIYLLPGTPLSGSIVSGSQAGPVSQSAATALAQIQQIVSGTFPSGTYINGQMIRSPIIIGNQGYISESFGVGNFTAGKGITLTGIGFSSSRGNIFYSDSPSIYIGQGIWDSPSTPFLVGSSSSPGALFFGLGNSGSGGWIGYSGSSTNASLEIEAKNFNLTTRTVKLSSNDSGTLLMGNAVNINSGSGIYADGYGNVRFGGESTGSGQAFFQFSINTGSLTGSLVIANSLINNTTANNLFVQSMDSRSLIYGQSANIGTSTIGSLYLDAASVTSGTYNIPDSFIIKSGSSSTEVMRFGRYLRAQTSTQTTYGTLNSSNLIIGSFDGNAPGTVQAVIATDSLTISAASDFLGGILQYSAIGRDIENNNVTTPYGVDHYIDVTSSWDSGYAVGTSTTYTTVEYGRTIGAAGIYDSSISNITITVPSTRVGNTLYLKSVLRTIFGAL